MNIFNNKGFLVSGMAAIGGAVLGAGVGTAAVAGVTAGVVTVGTAATVGALAVGAAYSGIRALSGSGQQSARQGINPMTGLPNIGGGPGGGPGGVGVSGSSSTSKGRAFLAAIGAPSKGFDKNPNTARSFLSSL